ncbi:MAG: hypothetical protein ACYDGR_13255 [Candidatus Dormibacteria bacterium]
MRHLLPVRNTRALAAGVVAVVSVAAGVWEFQNAIGPAAAGITGTASARAGSVAALLFGPLAAWQILRGRRWASHVGLTLTSLIFAGLLVVASLEAYNYILRYSLVAFGGLPLIAVIKGAVRYQIPQLLPLFALTVISAVGLAAVYRSRGQGGPVSEVRGAFR